MRGLGLLMAVMALGACGTRHESGTRVEVGGFSLMVPLGWVSEPGRGPGAVLLRNHATDVTQDMSVLAQPLGEAFTDDPTVDATCKTLGDKLPFPADSVGVVTLPVGKACQIIVSKDGTVARQLILKLGGHGAVVNCIRKQEGTPEVCREILGSIEVVR